MKTKITTFLLVLTAFVCSTITAQEQKPAVENYNIGDSGSGGGIVFYYSQTGFPVYKTDSATPVICHYLECSQEELGNIPWCSCKHKKWCNINTLDGIGAGKLNTSLIINYAHEKPINPTTCAAYACSQYSTETSKEGEWYLPSRIELNLIYKNLRLSRKIISDAWCWSSLQGNYYSAWGQRFSDGVQDYGYYSYGKDLNYAVRAVRAF